MENQGLGYRIPLELIKDLAQRASPRKIWSGYIAIMGHHMSQGPNRRIDPDSIYAVIHSDDLEKVTQETERTFDDWRDLNHMARKWFLICTTLNPEFDQNHVYSIRGFRGITNDLRLLNFVECHRQDRREEIPLNVNLINSSDPLTRKLAHYCPFSFE